MDEYGRKEIEKTLGSAVEIDDEIDILSWGAPPATDSESGRDVVVEKLPAARAKFQPTFWTQRQRFT